MNSANQGKWGDPWPTTYTGTTSDGTHHPTVVKLKPCPFCGAEAHLVYCVHGIGANWAVECSKIHAHRIEFSGTQDEVIKEWNRREEK